MTKRARAILHWLFMQRAKVRHHVPTDSRIKDAWQDGWICKRVDPLNERECGQDNVPQRQICFACGASKYLSDVAGCNHG